ncbi:MAG: hypothetical protein JOZ90_06215 [Alphaproteobacteria bacterium]|nr:hypothetical protein [Alphaproteobacteria bacterium]MBV9372701.1 hypothetical protein [Alphaproteobacteria bacterium]MBV9900674.1 hypothetical protein [Alphaproteobacteria bacterium]
MYRKLVIMSVSAFFALMLGEPRPAARTVAEAQPTPEQVEAAVAYAARDADLPAR